MIIPLGSWVLEEACRQGAAWTAEFGRKLEMSVNVSARQIADPQFAGQVAHVVESSGLAKGSLLLEITESVLMEQIQSSGQVLAALRSQGVRLLLDDFGTGFSSLSYLRELPVDTIKIDKSFVRGLEPTGRDAAIVEALIRMAHAVSMSAVAEGVETEVEREVLRGLGCDRVQGYLWSRPVPASQLASMLRGQGS